MPNTRKRHTADFKSKVAIDAIRQNQTTNELTTKHGVHATQINTWKKQALAAIPAAFKGSMSVHSRISRQKLMSFTAS